MKKVIVIYRTSTEEQEVESQKQEVISMAIADGYKTSEIVPIGCAGASAIKLDKKYLENIEEVYSTIEAGGIECVYAWAIDRIGRNEEILMQFKNRLIKHHVQLKIKTVSTPLFNAEGKVDAGFEMVYAFFATMAKQEMEQKQERFERARKRNLNAGKYNGGIIAVGYKIDENGFIAVDEESSKLVKLMFTLFNTGNYSTVSLAKELNERGYKNKNGGEFCSAIVCRMLKYKGYTGGFTDNKGRFHKLPAIITEEEQAKAINILKTNNTTQVKGIKHYYFANKLLVCEECGRHFQVLNNCYQCAGQIMAKREGTKHLSSCQNNTAITFKNLDGILWELTKELMIEEIESDHSQIETETKEQIAVLKQKIAALETKLSKYDKKIQEIVDNGDRLLQSEAIISRRIATVNKQREAEQKELVKLNEEVSRLENNLNYSATFQKMFTGYNSISDIEVAGDEQEMFNLVHRYVSKITVKRVTYKNNKNFQKIEVTTSNGVYVFFFHGRAKSGETCYVREPETDFEVPYEFQKIVRTKDGVTTEANERFKKFASMVKEIANKNHNMQDVWDLIAPADSVPTELSKLFDTVTRDNNQRSIQFLNQVATELGAAGQTSIRPYNKPIDEHFADHAEIYKAGIELGRILELDSEEDSE